MRDLPELAMPGERSIRMRNDLGLQGWFVGGTYQPGPSGTRASAMASGHGALAPPAAKRGWMDPVQLADITHSMTVIHRGQGSFTDVV